MVESILLDSAEDNFLSAASLSVGHGDNGRHLVGGVQDGIETIDGKVGGAEVYYSHYILERKFEVYVAIEGDHLKGGDGSFDAFVAMVATGTVKGLLHSIASEDTEDDGASMLYSDVGDTLRDGLADELEVTCLSLDDTADADDSVDLGA